MSEDEVLQAAIDRWGNTAQIMMACEEAAELTQALMHFLRGRGSKEAVAEEVADLMIMCRQMRRMFGSELVDDIAARKIERLKGRIADSERQIVG